MDAYAAPLANASAAEIPALIQRVLEDDAVYHFGRLLNSPKVAEAVSAEERAQYGRLLELFGYGVLRDYRDNDSQFPQLSARQLAKLKHLTLVSIASTTKVIKYDDLMAELDCPTEQSMEDLVIEAIYRNLIAARLDQKRRVVDVDFVVGRDVRRADLEDMHSRLDSWHKTCEEAMGELSADIDAAKEAAAAKIQSRSSLARDVQELRAAQAAKDTGSSAAPEGLPRSDSQYESSAYKREEQRTGSGP